MEVSLKGRWALVGGASQGIGEASARALSDNGVRVVLLARRADALQKVRATLKDPDQHRVLALDLQTTEAIAPALNLLLKDTGPITIWVNNTGGPAAGPLVDADTSAIEAGFRGHVLASQKILTALVPGMKEQRFGRIVNVLSTSTRVPLPNLGVSSLIRAAVASWAKTLSLELGPFGITVNSILPGYTATPRLESLLQGAVKKSGKTADAVRDEWIESIPARRLGNPAETAAAIAFFCSTAAGYINGTQLAVDGGRTGAL